MQHVKVIFKPDGLTASVHQGTSLLQAAQQAGVSLASPCGGIGRCGKCKVKLMPSGKEVLACQHPVHHELEVFVPLQSRLGRQQILHHGTGRSVRLEPIVRKVVVQSLSADITAACQQIQRALHERVGKVLPAPQVSSWFGERLAQAGDSHITAVLFEHDVFNACQNRAEVQYHLMDLEPGDTRSQLYGVAVDIGTTTLVATLVDLNTGQPAAVASCRNPQAPYGADVISRINYASDLQGADRLQQVIVEAINGLIGQVCQQAHIDRQSVYEVVTAGNTTMQHLLLHFPVRQLGQAPYHAWSVKAEDLPARSVGLAIHPRGMLHTIENIAGFVGSDTVAAAVAAGMEKIIAPTLLVDIGTNGEIVLGVGDKLWSASCAAGPALEGATISCGSPAQEGAIQRVLVENDRLEIDVIGGSAPVSICGSGLIDAVAVLLDLGVIDISGRFQDLQSIYPPLPGALAKRLVSQPEPAFVFSANGAANMVALTQRDIRQFQLAKAAIRAGIQLLCKQAQLAEHDLQQILLAGAFGNYIRRESALRVGLLPDVPLERVRFIGNAASAGAMMILTSRAARCLAAHLSQRIEYIEIAHQLEFHQVFSECLMFPEAKSSR